VLIGLTDWYGLLCYHIQALSGVLPANLKLLVKTGYPCRLITSEKFDGYWLCSHRTHEGRHEGHRSPREPAARSGFPKSSE
jgi:hypothetical protein